jgi:two-component system sensor histidine kinase TctE
MTRADGASLAEAAARPPAGPSLRGQLLRWVLVPLVLVLLIDVAGGYVAARQVADDIYDGELAEIARELLVHVKQTDGKLAFDLSDEAERTLLLDQYDKVYYAVRAADGSAIAGDGALPRIAGRAAFPDMTFRDAEYGGAQVRLALLRSPALAHPGSAPVAVEVAETQIKRRLLTRKLLLSVTLPQVLLILAAGALVWFGVARGLAPLRHVQRAVAARSHLDLAPVASADAPAELYPLVQEVNDLMQRLSKVLDAQSRFIADAAHQLRTPVAGLKAHVELALRENDMAQAKRALAHLYTGVERLARLVSQLLSLARNEPDTAKTQSFAPLDLNRLAFETTMDWVPEAYKKDIDLGFEGGEGALVIDGDAARLTELINNLLDNAIRYSPNGGRVTMRVSADGAPRLAVSDDGPKIPVEERQRVFERFHRLLGTHTEGSGLGLAIVREIAELHGAEVSLEDDADGVGNRFIVSFPPAAR